MTLLSFDRQMALVNRGLATNKNDGVYTTFKYAKKAMYDYLWHEIPDLLECRGHVYENATQNLVQAAPKKSFNYLEKGWWAEKPMSTRVEMYRKINGYMACASYNGADLVVSTTGTTTSDYAKNARRLIENDPIIMDMITDYYTLLLEVVVPEDPHIVDEYPGLYVLGKRHKETGDYVPNGSRTICSLEDALRLANEDKGEGFMVYLAGSDYSSCCKIKTPYYSGKKKLMRMTKKNVELMYNQTQTIENQLPDMWKFAPKLIIEYHTQDVWSNATDQQRRKFLEFIE